MAEKVGEAAIAGIVILSLLSLLFGLSYLISFLLRLPYSLAEPIWVRIVGGAITVIGLAVASWLFRYRKPEGMIISTYVTFSKLFRRVPIKASAQRSEQLVFKGPQKYVRHPLYLGLIVMVFGWGLFTETTYVLIASAVLLTWFRLILIPFEEKELLALFGSQYERYMESTPMLAPFTKHRHAEKLSK